jgi:hypothetical protein
MQFFVALALFFRALRVPLPAAILEKRQREIELRMVALRPAVGGVLRFPPSERIQ